MGHVASAMVARPPNKPKPGKLYRVHVMLPPELVDLIDRYAAERPSPDGLPITRTEAIRILVREGLKRHGLLK